MVFYVAIKTQKSQSVILRVWRKNVHETWGGGLFLWLDHVRNDRNQVCGLKAWTENSTEAEQVVLSLLGNDVLAAIEHVKSCAAENPHEAKTTRFPSDFCSFFQLESNATWTCFRQRTYVFFVLFCVKMRLKDILQHYLHTVLLNG